MVDATSKEGQEWLARLEDMKKLVQARQTIGLDLGCGENKQVGFIGMDQQALEGVELVWDLEKFPWPIPDSVCHTVIASHIIEHIDPHHTIALFNEVWRVTREGGKFMIATPYAGSQGYWQDPTHCNGFTYSTFQYFDPYFPLYSFYKPKPWRISWGFPAFQVDGNLEIIMIKLADKPQEYFLTEEIKERLMKIARAGGGLIEEESKNEQKISET